MSAQQFISELNKEWADKQRDIGEAIVDIAEYALTGVVRKSPEDTSRFIGNWNVSIGVPDSHTTINVDPGGVKSLSRGKEKLAEYKNFDNFPSIFISNSLPYALALENGHSSQAPSGMVALTVAEIEVKFSGVNL